MLLIKNHIIFATYTAIMFYAIFLTINYPYYDPSDIGPAMASVMLSAMYALYLFAMVVKPMEKRYEPFKRSLDKTFLFSMIVPVMLSMLVLLMIISTDTINPQKEAPLSFSNTTTSLIQNNKIVATIEAGISIELEHDKDSYEFEIKRPLLKELFLNTLAHKKLKFYKSKNAEMKLVNELTTLFNRQLVDVKVKKILFNKLIITETNQK